MNILSLQYWIIIALVGIVYYKIKHNKQWIILLIASTIIYLLLSGFTSLLYIVWIILVTWGGTYAYEYCNDGNISNRKRVSNYIIYAVVLIIIVSLGAVGGATKYIANKTIFYPLGISYVSLQAIGYVLDVYWGNIEAERNIFKVALFLLFFPQVIQGPITNWKQLSTQFYIPHKFDLEMVERGAILVMWGYMKKVAIADRVGVVVEEVFSSPGSYYGATIGIALLLYSAQLYSDFSGGIDIVTGIAMMFDINLMENFRRPYFSKSLSDFWRRWHISLGKWMKDYVYFPLGTSKLLSKIGGKIKRKCGVSYSRAFTIFVCNCLIFCLVGIWHGFELHYIIWGLYNGIIISISNIYFRKYENKLMSWGVKTKSKTYLTMRVLITFLIVNFGWIMDRSVNVYNMSEMMKNLFYLNKSISIYELFAQTGFISPYDWMIVLVAIAAIFIVSLLMETSKMKFWDIVYNKNIVVRWFVLYVLIFFIAASSVGMNGTGGFMYAQF